MPYFFRKLCALGLVVLHTTGCYKLVPVAPAATTPNSQVVLEFTDVGAEQLGGLLGNAVASARGRSILWTPDTVRLSMLATTTRAGSEQYWTGQPVSIPRTLVARVQERRLDRGRTTLFALTGVALAVLTQQVIKGSSSGTPRPPVIPPEQ